MFEMIAIWGDDILPHLLWADVSFLGFCCLLWLLGNCVGCRLLVGKPSESLAGVITGDLQ